MTDIKIHIPKIDNEHQDSFWYDGNIAETEHFYLEACGETRIFKKDKDGNYIGEHDGYKSRDDFGEVVDDNNLSEIRSSDDYYVDMHNWFEITEKGHNDEIGEVYDTYDEGIAMLKDLEENYKSKENNNGN